MSIHPGRIPAAGAGDHRQFIHVRAWADPIVATQGPPGKAELTDIPRVQRWAHRPGLKRLFSARVRRDKCSRDAAMPRACLEYGYTTAAVAREAGIQRSTVSGIVKGQR